MHSNGDCVFQNFLRRTNWSASASGCGRDRLPRVERQAGFPGACDFRMKSRIQEVAMRETYGGKPKTMNSPRQVLSARLIGTAVEFSTSTSTPRRRCCRRPIRHLPRRLRWQRSRPRSSRDRSAERCSGACEDPSGRHGCDPRP